MGENVKYITVVLLLFCFSSLAIPGFISEPYDGSYDISGSISYVVDEVRQTQSYNIIDTVPVEGEVEYAPDIYAWSRADVLSVSADAFGGGIYDPYYGGSIGQCQATTAWSFQPMVERAGQEFGRG